MTAVKFEMSDGAVYEFEYLGAAARAMSKKLQLSPSMLRNCMSLRAAEIKGAKVSYDEEKIFANRGSGQSKPVLVRMGGKFYSFEMYKEAARFLADKFYYAVGTMESYLHKRKPKIYGADIFYKLEVN